MTALHALRVASGFAMMMRAFLLAVLTSGHFVPAAARVTHSVAREDAVGHAAARPNTLPLSDLARPSHHFPTSQPAAGPAITPGATLQATVDQAVAAGARELRVPQAVYVFNASSLVISGAKDLTIVFEPGLSESITAKCADVQHHSNASQAWRLHSRLRRRGRPLAATAIMFSEVQTVLCIFEGVRELLCGLCRCVFD